MNDPDPSPNPRDRDEAGGSGRVSSTFRLLADRDRRILLRYQAYHRGERVQLRDLADAIVSGRPADSSHSQMAVEITLRHSHLPNLADAGIIEYDARRGVVRYDGDEFLESVLAFLDDADVD